jgi:hypothetical protein
MVNVLAIDPRFVGSNLAEARVFKGNKNPKHASLRRGSKARGSIL